MLYEGNQLDYYMDCIEIDHNLHVITTLDDTAAYERYRATSTIETLAVLHPYRIRSYSMNSSHVNLLHTDMIRRTVRVNTSVIYLSRECNAVTTRFTSTLRSLTSTTAGSISMAKIA